MNHPSRCLFATAAIPFLTALLPISALAEVESNVTDDDLLLARNPIIIRSRVSAANEYKDLEGGGSTDKIYVAGVYGFGFDGNHRDYGVGLELPLLINNSKGADSASGLGDIKIRLGHLFVDQPLGWRAGCYFDNEFDTAANNVQSIANQRNQMALGGGGAYSIHPNFVLGSTVQYGWSTDSGATNGNKSEWEGHLTATVKLPHDISITLDYKFTDNIMAGSELSNTLEPIIGWTFGEKNNFGLFASCEIPFDDAATNCIAKAGLTWFY